MKFKCAFLVITLLLAVMTPAIEAQRRGGGGGRAGGGGARAGGGGGQVNRGAASTSIRSNQTVNRNVNQNRDINRDVNRDVSRDIDRDVDIDRDWDVDVGYDRWGHPVARGLAYGTAAAIAYGTTVAMLPTGCSTVVVNGIAYSQCGSTWYEPYYGGTEVQYVVVSPPQ